MNDPKRSRLTFKSAYDPHRSDYGVPATTWRRRLAYASEIVADRLLFALLRPLPLDLSTALFGALGSAILPRTQRFRVVLDNLALALPELNQVERERIARNYARYSGRLMAEFSQLNRVLNQAETRCDIHGAEHLEAAKAAGRPLVLILAHLGNWELMSYWVPRFAQPAPSLNIYAKPRNPAMDRAITRIRSQFGLRLVPRVSGRANVQAVQATLSAGGIFGILPDQRLNGPNLPFFGHPARTMIEHFRWGKAANALFIPTQVKWVGPGVRYQISFHPPLEEGTPEAPRQIRDLARETNAIFEAWIREAPEQWFWAHKRWEPIDRRQRDQV